MPGGRSPLSKSCNLQTWKPCVSAELLDVEDICAVLGKTGRDARWCLGSCNSKYIPGRDGLVWLPACNEVKGVAGEVE